MTSSDRRYFIGSDNSGHKYLVPVSIMDEWTEWSNLSEDDERSWEPPAEAVRIDGSLVTFCRPEVSGVPV